MAWSGPGARTCTVRPGPEPPRNTRPRSEEHTSELQSPCNLVCRLLLEKKKERTHFTLVVFGPPRRSDRLWQEPSSRRVLLAACTPLCDARPLRCSCSHHPRIIRSAAWL